MINYQSQATRDANNKEAERVTGVKAAGHREGPSRETPDDVRRRCGDKRNAG